jgi:hypothetical protein
MGDCAKHFFCYYCAPEFNPCKFILLFTLIWQTCTISSAIQSRALAAKTPNTPYAVHAAVGFYFSGVARLCEGTL